MTDDRPALVLSRAARESIARPVLPVAVAPAMTRSGGAAVVIDAAAYGYRVAMATDVPEQRQVRRGREARQAARLARAVDTLPYLTRQLAPVEVISTEGLEQIEHNADTLLEQVGIEIVNYPEAVEIFRGAGADVEGQRVRFPRGLCRSLITATAPRVFTQRARNPARSVVIGDPHMVLVPTYGSPFVHDLDGGRRYATIEDFRNFVKLTYTIAHAPPRRRHAVRTGRPAGQQAPLRHGLQPHPLLGPGVHGLGHPPATVPRTPVEMARIVFGAETLEREHVIMGLANANSPMSWDFNMLGSAKAYAEANQIMLITPFILGGAMAPVTVAAQATQTLAEALAGMAFCQIVRPGAPVIFGSFASSMSMQTGAPTFGTPEPQLVLFVLAALSRRLGVPFRSGGNFTASKVPDYQAAYESAISFMATMQAGVNFNLHTAGWLEGGLSIGYEKFILDEDQASMAEAYLAGVDTSDNGYALDAMLGGGPGQHFLGAPHTLANFETAFWRSGHLEQRQLRAVGARWRPRRRRAGQRGLEGAPGRVRAAAARRGDRRGAARLDRRAQGELPGLGRLVAASGRRRGVAARQQVVVEQVVARSRRVERHQVVAQDRRLSGGSSPASTAASATASSRAWSRRSSSGGMWQRIRCPGSTSMSGGSVTSHRFWMKRWQRVWKTQPLGGSAGLGMSPSRRMRGLTSPSTLGTADSSASVYGWFGPSNRVSDSADLLDPARGTSPRSGRRGSGRRPGRGRSAGSRSCSGSAARTGR